MSEQVLLIKNGRVIDPATKTDSKLDILVVGDSISEVGPGGSLAGSDGAVVIDATGKLVTPGLTDIHVHFREPGFEWKETIETGSLAAVAGGFTRVCCMPNTNPTNHSAEVSEFIVAEGKKHNLCHVHPIASITLGLEGKEMSPMLELKEAGAVAFSDDGRPVWDAGMMRRACEYSLMFDTVLTLHEEELSLSNEFSMNESPLSVKLGLKGMPGAAEDALIARDIEIARLTGARVHFCHVSTARAVTLIERAKADGISVTAEVTPHHLLLTEELVSDFDTNYKMSMPLRTNADNEALIDGLARGVIDCVASDHAPHEADSKKTEFANASFGILGLQTTVPLLLSLVRDDKLTLERFVECLTTDPARCFRFEEPSISAGKRADITIIDLEKKITLSKDVIKSKSKNTPFLDTDLTGVAIKTIFGGRVVYNGE